MASIILSANKALPRDVDVTVNVSKPQAETTSDFSVMVFCTPNAPFDHGANRIQFYITLDAVQETFEASSEVYKAATAWFSQSPRAKTFAVGKIFESNIEPTFLQCGVNGADLDTWKSVTNGSLDVIVTTANGTVSTKLTGMNFSGISDVAGVAPIIAAKYAEVNTTGTPIKVTYDTEKNLFRFTLDTSNVAPEDLAMVAEEVFQYFGKSATGTDLGTAEYLNGQKSDTDIQESYIVPGYIPAGIASELNYIKEAASASGKFLYAWALDAVYRDEQASLDAAAWVEAQTAAIIGIVTNSPFAYDASSVGDVGSVMKSRGYKRSFVVYHDNPFYYPEVSILAYALSVNYAAFRSTITTKFKTLQGIPTVPITVSELTTLTSKRINTYTAVGNSSRTFREGVEVDSSWFIDDLINLDNFREELQTAVYNVFLQNKKVPYTELGVTLLYTAMAEICDRYVYNGTFAERQLSDAEAKVKGFPTDPAYTITFTPLGNMTVSERALRVGPPAVITVNLAGAIHSIDISVEAYS